uniref:PQQ-binding-like beta-propeller repeat protein n=1 Tax=Microbulbifer agarilyticus TaxID=260552 RepID=UPI000255AA0E|nr:PQQ-binding-like beta-propeller repeat protein [Microbulbifer agarilyticus]
MPGVTALVRLVLLASIFVLSACGGGGSSGGSDAPIQDVTPNQFTFSSIVNADWEVWVESEAVSVQGINEAVDISIEGGEYSVNGGEFTSESGSVNVGDSVVVRVMTSPEFATETAVTLSISNVSATFSVTTSAEREKPTAAILFPHIDGLVVGARIQEGSALVTVRGTAADNVEVQRVTVNGVDAISGEDGVFETWSADIYLTEPGENSIVIEVEDVNGNINDAAATRTVALRRDEGFAACRSVDFDATSNHIVSLSSVVTTTDVISGEMTHFPVSGNYYGSALNTTTGKMYAFDVDGSVFELSLSSTPDSVISWDGTDGVSFRPENATIDSSANILYMFNSASNGLEWALYSVDLASGARALVSSESYGSGAAIGNSRAIAAANGRLFAHARQGDQDQIIEIDLATGNRVVASSNSVGTGYDFQWAMNFTVNSSGDKAYVGDFYDELLEVNLDTGERRLISGKYDYLATNLVFEQNFDMAVDDVNGDIYLGCVANHLIAIDIDTGERRQITQGARGQGAPINRGQSARYDSVNDRVLLINELTQSYAYEIMAVDPISGDRKIVTSEVIGSGADIGRFRDFAVSALDGDIYLAQSWWDSASYSEKNTVVEVDAETGDRKLVSGTGRGLGPVFTQITAIEIVEETGIAYVLDRDVDAIFQVELSTGNRQIVSQPGGAGGGVDWQLPTYTALNPEQTLLYVSEQSTGTIYQVDLATGQREVFSSDDVGEGPGLGEVTQIRLDAYRNKLLVESLSVTGVQPMIYVDLETGDREFFDARNANTGFRGAVDAATGWTYLNGYDGEVLIFDFDSRQALRLSQ